MTIMSPLFTVAIVRVVCACSTAKEQYVPSMQERRADTLRLFRKRPGAFRLCKEITGRTLFFTVKADSD